MSQEESEDLKDFLVKQASEAVFLFNQIYAGVKQSTGSQDHAVRVATQLTSEIIRNIAIIAQDE